MQLSLEQSFWRSNLPSTPAWMLFWAAALTTIAGLVAVEATPAVAAGAILCGAVAAVLLATLAPTLDYRLTKRPMGKLVAFVGCDGSGKSTLTSQLSSDLRDGLPIRTCYLGLGSGALGEKIKRVPLIGSAFERRLARKATQSRTKGAKIPGLPTAIVIYCFSLLRLRRFKRMLRLRQNGCIVLTDRYPQTECPGFYDGPGLAAGTAGSWAVAWLVKRERRIYAWMVAFHPDVVVRLNVDAETALARKPEHRPDLIRRKVAVTPQLRFAGAKIIDLDATQSLATVHAAALRIVRRVLR